MHFRLLLTSLTLLLATLPCLGEPEVDVEDVPTPLSLPDLLPPEGLEAVDAEFWMRITASYKDRHIDYRFIHWHIRHVDGQLVCTLESGRSEIKQHSIATMTYSKEGKLTAYRNVSHNQGQKTSDVIGEVVDNELILKTTNYRGEQKTTESEKKSLDVFEKTLPSEWFTIVAAYHIRKGSLSYSFSRSDTAFNFQHAETTIEDVGTEEVQWDGKTYTGHMLLGERTFGSNRQKTNPDSKLQYLLLPNGEMMYMRNLYHGYKFLGYRVTKEDIAKEFWLPPTEEEQE
jgi:predicted GNAT family N-acyltransferase